jgi:hypothetical protein
MVGTVVEMAQGKRPEEEQQVILYNTMTMQEF